MRPSALNLCSSLAPVLILLAPSVRPGAIAQSPTPPTASATLSYSEESSVIEHDDSVYSYNADGTGFRERTMVVRVQSEAALRSLGVVAVPYAGDSERVEFAYARVRRSDGTVVETQTSDALDMPEEVTRAAPFYSDLKEKQLPIRSLRVGDTLEWKAHVVRTKAESPGEFWQQLYADEGEVVLSETLELRVPQGMYVNVWSPSSKLAESVEDGQHIYRWSSSQLKPTAGKEAEAAAEAKKKQVWTSDEELDAEQGKLPTVAWTTFRSWEEVGAWYRGLEADREAASPEIKSKVAELIAGKTSEEDKARAIYAYVSAQIRYIGVDFGVGRYQPHSAAEILANQYGDCKDKHTLLAAMLSTAGINADAVLIGAGIRFNAAVPSPASFNHLITRAMVAGQPVWLDSTAEVAPYRLLYPVIRDRQALVVPASRVAHLDRSPASPPFPSYQTMNAVGSLDKVGISHSRLTFVFRGDAELVLRSAFRQVAPAQYNEMVQQISHSIGYAGTTSNPEISRPEDTTEPFKMSFDYEREKAGDWDNYRIIPQVAPVSLPRFQDTDPLVRELNLGYPNVDTSTAEMKLPEGWGAVLPEAVHLKCPYASYDETYRIEKGTVYTERRIEVLKQKVPVADLKVYKKWADDADLGNETYIQLTRTPAAAPAVSGAGEKAKDADSGPGGSKSESDGPPIVSATNVEATRLVQAAWASMQQKDFDAAAKSLDQVKALNPEQAWLWMGYGLLALQHNAYPEALDDLKKELKLHPAQTAVYALELEVYERLAQHQEELDTLRAWVVADPADPSPVTTLMNMLVADGDAKSAASLGDAAIAQLPDDPKKTENFHIALGNAQIKAGERDKGAASLEAVLKNADTPGALNDAAYELADAGLDLPLAQRSARAVLDKLTAESDSWTLDEDANTLKGQSSLIVATWDTVGWIFFREGQLAEAQDYLNAAWTAGQNADTAEHLGEVLLARGNKAAAMVAFELALTKSATYDSMGVRRPPGPLGKDLQQRIEALTKAGVKSTIGTEKDPYKQLQAMRTIPLGDEGGKKGNVDAEYRLLLRAGKLVKAGPAGTKEIVGADKMVDKAKFDAFFPPGSQTALVRFGYVNCHSGVCELVLEP
jgi:tetratricopeptide (TPR) repeat protein